MLVHARSLVARLRSARLRSDQRGQTLVEVLVAGALGVIVIGAVGMLLVSSERQQQKNANYDEAQGSAQVELDAMTSQIRDAWNIVSWGPNYVDMDVDIGGAPYQVYYECDIPTGTNGWNECVRLQTSVSTTTLPSLSTGTTVIPYLSNGTSTAPVFSWRTEATAPTASSTTTTTTTAATAFAPDYVSATIDVPASNGVTSSALSIARTIAFSEGALIRNVDVEN